MTPVIIIFNWDSKHFSEVPFFERHYFIILLKCVSLPTDQLCPILNSYFFFIIFTVHRCCCFRNTNTLQDICLLTSTPNRKSSNITPNRKICKCGRNKNPAVPFTCRTSIARSTVPDFVSAKMFLYNIIMRV